MKYELLKAGTRVSILGGRSGIILGVTENKPPLYDVAYIVRVDGSDKPQRVSIRAAKAA